ncbi:MAG: thioredoxin domain-containing protein [Pseudomonadales bacterium]|nr:thioredoxin domain-containing protein [Pseudomonadales bacterium]
MSKKEEQRRIREQKRLAAEKREKMTGRALRLGMFALIPLVLYLLYLGLFKAAPVYMPAELAGTDHVRGNPEAALTLTVYADFQCPACFTEEEIIARAWPRIEDRIRLVFRHYPLDSHRHAFLAASYAEAAGRQGRFWEMHDFLYANQAVWAVLDNPSSSFDGYALQLGLDMDKLKSDIEMEAVRAKILADQKGGTRAGVRGTPALFINGRLISNPRSSSELISMVNQALENL